MVGLILALSFLAGVLLHDSQVGLILTLPIGLATLLAALTVKHWTSRIVIVLALSLLCIGAWRAAASDHVPAEVLVHLSGSSRAIDARVIGIPSVSTTRTRATIKLLPTNDVTITASLPPWPVVSDGDVIRFSAPSSWDTQDPGIVQLPQASGSGGLFIASITVVASHPSSLSAHRTAIDSFAMQSIQRYVPEPAGALTLGILNGDDSGMTDATRMAFRSAGMSHITAVSGWNVAIVAGLIALLLRRQSPGRWMPVVAGIAGIWSYAFLVGMEPSVLRAGGMATIFLLAHLRGRPGDLLTSLLITTAVMVAVTPKIRFDIGFQLSVAATLGLVLLLESAVSRPWWQQAIAIPLVAEIAVAPLLLHHLGTYSVLAPVANLVTAPLVELVMGGGIATLMATFIHPALAGLAGTFTWVPARLIVATAEFTSSVRWSSAATMTLSWSATLMSYLALVLAYVWWNRFTGSSRPPILADDPI